MRFVSFQGQRDSSTYTNLTYHTNREKVGKSYDLRCRKGLQQNSTLFYDKALKKLGTEGTTYFNITNAMYDQQS